MCKLQPGQRGSEPSHARRYIVQSTSRMYMSNSPVDAEQDTGVGEEEIEEESSPTLAAFRIPSDSVIFYRRMAQHMYQGGLIKEPKLAALAKACLNLIGRRYAAYEEVALATYVQKNLAQARGPGVVSVQQIQREQAAKGNAPKKTVQDFIPSRLKRPPPVDMNMPEPEWMQGW